jgi:hypothetical protein
MLGALLALRIPTERIPTDAIQTKRTFNTPSVIWSVFGAGADISLSAPGAHQAGSRVMAMLLLNVEAEALAARRVAAIGLHTVVEAEFGE